MRFRDRSDAGLALGTALGALALGDAAAFAIPRGGVVVAEAIVRALGWPLDLVVPRKLRAPRNPELAIGAVTEDGTVYLDARLAQALRADAAYLVREIAAQLAEIERRTAAYRRGRPAFDVRGRRVVVVDDGLATGATAIAAVRMLRHQLAREVLVAVPVAPSDAVGRMEREADRIVCVERPPEFSAVGAFYEDFAQITDDEVLACLARAWDRGSEAWPRPH